LVVSYRAWLLPIIINRRSEMQKKNKKAKQVNKREYVQQLRVRTSLNPGVRIVVGPVSSEEAYYSKIFSDSSPLVLS